MIDGHLYKVAQADSQESTPVTFGDDRHGVDTDWRLPCSDGGTHEFRTEWRPRRTDDEQVMRGQKSQQFLRPLARADQERFNEVFGRRNIAESINSWHKTTLASGAGSARAKRLDADGQHFDHLCAAVLANALTYDYYRQTNRK